MSSRTSRFQVEFAVSGDGTVQAELGSIAKQAERTAESARKTGADWAEMGSRMRTGLLWAGAGVAAGVALIVNNTMKAQQELAQLDAILKSTGEAAGYSRDQLVSMADGLAGVSTFSGGEIIEAQTRLLSYSGILGENIPRAMQAVIDQSARLGISVTQSAETIGRALESPSKAAAALAQQGFGAAFTREVRDTIAAMVDAGREAEAQRMILEILEESYGGAALAARETFGGALQSLKHRLDDLMTGREGTLDGAADAVNRLNDALNDPKVRDGANDMIEALSDIGSTAASALGPAIVSLLRMREIMQGVVGQASAVGEVARGAFTFDRAQMARGVAAYGSASTSIDQAFGVGRESNSPAAQFARVRGGVRVKAPGSDDNSDLISPDLQKQVDSVNEQARAMGLSRTALAELNREKALSAATNDTERAAINGAYDALVKRMGADEGATKGAQAAKRARDEQVRAEEQLTRLFERTTAAYREQTALQYDASEAARTRYSIESGALAAMSEPRQREILQLAEARDAQQRLDAVRREGLALSETLYTPLERMRAAQDEYTAALARGSIDQETWNKLITRSREELDAAEESARRNFPSMSMLVRDFSEGAQMRMGDDLFDVFSGNADRIEERWKSLLLQMAADLLASKLMEGFGSAAGGGAGNGGTGFWGSLIQSFMGGRAVGGGVRRDGLYEVTEQGRPELLRQGTKTYLMPGADGVVVPAHAAAATGAAGAGSAPAQIQINNYGSERVEAREQTSMGANGEMMRKYVIDIGREALNGGAWSNDLKNRFGLRESVG